MSSVRVVQRMGVFDSGVGGITVLQALRRKFPSVEFVYLGDTANVPYGTKSPSQIEHLSRLCAQRLRDEKIDVLVVACNTASSWALPAIRQEVGPLVDVIGMVEPGVASVLDRCLTNTGPILVLATRATVRSGAYRRAFETALSQDSGGPGVRDVFEQACPLLVPMIEEGWLDHKILLQTIDEYLSTHRQQGREGIALLGCTHYPWIRTQIESRLPGWTVVDSAESVAQYLASRVAASGATLSDQPSSPEVKWIFTDPEAVPEFARKILRSL